MPELDWSLARTPDFATNALQSAAAGRQEGQIQARQNALRTYATDPNAGITQLMSVDPATAVTLQRAQAEQRQQASAVQAGQAYASGDTDGATRLAAGSGNFDLVSKLQGMTEKQRADASAVYGQLASAAQSVASLPYEQRKGALQAQAPRLQALGISPDRLAAFDPTDQNISSFVNGTLGVQQQIEQARQARTDAKPAFTTLKDGAVERLVQTNPQADGATFVPGQGWTGGAAPPQGAAAGEPAAAAPVGSAPQVPGPVGQQITAAAQSAGATPDELAYLHRTAQIESSGNPAAQNGQSTGLFQFHPSTFAAAGGKDINSVTDQTTAALTLARQDRAALSQALGRDPTPSELYIAHQQGAPAAVALLTVDQNAPASAALAPIYRNPTVAQKAITGNGGSANMTAGQFLDMWRQRYGQQPSAAPAAQGAPPAATPAGPGAPSAQPAPADAAPASVPPAGWQPRTVMTGQAAPKLEKATDASGVEHLYDVTNPAAPKEVPTGATSQGAGDPNLTGVDFLKTLPKATAAQVQAVIDGRMAPPSPNSRAPQARMLLQYAAQADPQGDYTTWLSRSKTRQDFASGGKSGQNVTSLNTALGHLDDLDHAVDALHNTPLDWVNGPAQFVLQHGGDARTQAAVADFTAKKKAAADELTRVFRGTGGSEGDIQGYLAQLDSAKSPDALHATVRSMVKLLASRLDALSESRDRGMSTSDQLPSLLTAKAQASYDRLSGVSGGQKPGSSAPGGVDPLSQARAAIAAGAPRAAVIQRLQKLGLNPAGL